MLTSVVAGIAALLAPAAAQQAGGRDSAPLAAIEDSIRQVSFFAATDSLAAAAGLPTLHATPQRTGDREYRLWSDRGLFGRQVLVRLLERSGQVSGEVFQYWDLPPEERTGPQPPVPADARCRPVGRAGGVDACRLLLDPSPDWMAVLRQVDSLGAATLPSSRALGLDGWSLEVELRAGTHYRFYRYYAPQPAGPPGESRAAALFELTQALVPGP